MATNSTTAELPTKLDRSNELIYVQTTFLVLAGLCVLLRVYVKAIIVRHQALDDFLIYGAMIGYTAYGAIAIDGAINGATGKHVATGYTMLQAARSLRGWYLCMAIYAPVTLTIRASVCVLLLRLSTSKHFKRLVYANLILIAIISTAFFFIAVFQCSPPSYFWMQVLGSKGYCHNKLIITYATTVHSALSAASDWCLGLMPIALLWNVKINRRTKATVAFLLSLGMIAGVALIVRIPYVTRLPPGLDFLYKSLDVAVWSVLEPALGIIAACFATFRPLFKNWGFGWKTANASPSGHIPLSGDVSSPRRQRWDGTSSSQQPRRHDGSGTSSGDERLNSSIELKEASSVNETIYTKEEAHARDVERGRVNTVAWRNEDSDR